MVRTHTLVEFRRKQHELELALRGLEKQQEEADYKLDVEFYLRLEALAKEHGYSFAQVFDLLESRYKSSADSASGNVAGSRGAEPLCLKTRTTTGLLDLIDRLQPNGGNGVKRESVLDSDAMLTVGLPPKPVIDSPVPALAVEADSDEPANEEKTND
ncbi:hypothetical protein [Pseudomonas frederiksbergensis]|uniref:Uncharacterized protein n=1 Tax=Pseudomonas frederiksbergensis TaxID=104087 RepID=A0A0B1Z756_9PSED|nr:hypothetical protein [Pseudomonas frederiksbergensis]KHK66435.1 hypothetical protein JZ00_00950 [Pseudomonas frederiksbergensis]